MMYDDAFMIELIPADMVKRLHYVAGMVPFLHKLSQGVSPFVLAAQFA